jgi:hypothetical protein
VAPEAVEAARTASISQDAVRKLKQVIPDAGRSA